MVKSMYFTTAENLRIILDLHFKKLTKLLTTVENQITIHKLFNYKYYISPLFTKLRLHEFLNIIVIS